MARTFAYFEFQQQKFNCPIIWQVCVQLRMSPVNATLLAFAAERRCSWVPGVRRCRSISPARTALSSKPAARRGYGRMMGQTDRQTDGVRTDARPFHRPCSAYCASSVNKCNCWKRIYTFININFKNLKRAMQLWLSEHISPSQLFIS